MENILTEDISQEQLIALDEWIVNIIEGTQPDFWWVY